MGLSSAMAYSIYMFSRLRDFYYEPPEFILSRLPVLFQDDYGMPVSPRLGVKRLWCITFGHRLHTVETKPQWKIIGCTRCDWSGVDGGNWDNTTGEDFAQMAESLDDWHSKHDS